MLAFLPNIGAMELIIILAIGLLLFGRRLPEIGRSVGKAIVEFKKGVKGVEDEIESGSNAPAKPALNPGGDARTVSRSETVEERAG